MLNSIQNIVMKLEVRNLWNHKVCTYVFNHIYFTYNNK